MQKRILILIYLFVSIQFLNAQVNYFEDYTFSEADSLRGMLRPERTCFDVTFYDLNIEMDFEKKSIKGYNEIHFTAIEDFDKLQIDLFDNMSITKIVFGKKELKYERKHNAVFIHFPKQKKDVNNSFRVYYEGIPIQAKNPPWDGGFIWRKDNSGNDWVAVACEGIGASLWFPNKDHLSDEPDSVKINIAVPNEYQCVSNGNLIESKPLPLSKNLNQFSWLVTYPINNYNITFNIAKYTHFSDTYKSETDESVLDLDYYVLPENLEKAKKQFQQVKPMLKCYEEFFGKYPFWNDGFALVETPYLGMEHQSAIAYGNKYMSGYLGGMLPEGIDFDYIIIHEAGHEYWGNSISTPDHAEMWIHESFCTYSEALYVECMYNYEDAIRYLLMQRRFINNRQPIIGPLNVNFDKWKASDHYYKGSWVLHTLRNAINDDEVWFGFIKSFSEKHVRSVVDTKEILAYLNEYTESDYSAFFEQYLYHPNIPILLYKLKQKGENLIVQAKWECEVENFDMPVQIGKMGKYHQIKPTTKVQEFIIKNMSKEEFRVAEELFLVKSKSVGK